MQILSSSPEGHIQDSQRPVIASYSQVTGAHIIAPHTHARGQLLYASTGNIAVTVNASRWYLGPGSAVWIPPDAEHTVTAGAGETAYQSVYVTAGSEGKLGAHADIISVPPLLRQLIHTACEFGADFNLDTAESRLMVVLKDQLGAIQPELLTLPVPQRKILHQLCSQLLQQPQRHISLACWGKEHGATERHLARLFKQETGLSYQQWCLRNRVRFVICRLDAGYSVSQVSAELGYASASALSAMFRRIAGTSPRQYVASRSGH